MVFYNRFKPIIFLLLLIQTLVACSKSRINGPEHKPAPEYISGNFSDHEINLTIASLESHYNYFHKLKSTEFNVNDLNYARKSIDFTKFLFNKNFIENYRKFDEIIISNSLHFINKTIIISKNSNPDLSNTLLDQYREALLDGCSSDNYNNCKNLSFFSLDHLTSNVIHLIAMKSEKENPKSFFRLLLLAKELRSYSDTTIENIDNDLIETSLKLISAAFEITKQGDGFLHFKLKEKNHSALEEIRIYTDYIATILDVHTDAIHHINSGVQKTLFSWLFNSNFPEIVGFKIAKKYYSFLSKTLQKENFSDSISSILKNTKPASPSSNLNVTENFFQAYSELESTMPLLLKLIPSEKNGNLLYVYLSQKVFTQQKFSELELVLDILDKDYAEIIDTFIAIEKVYFLNTVMKSHQQIAKIFNNLNINPENSTAGSVTKAEKLLSKSIDDIRFDLSPLWNDFNSRHRRMKLFFERYIEPNIKEKNKTEYAESLKKIKLFYDEIGHNTKYFVTYPSLLMLAYYSQKYNYRETIYNSFFPNGKYTITPNLIISELLNGSMPPLFVITDFSENNAPISTVEIFYSIYFLLENNLLTLYNVPVRDWFFKITDAYFKNSQYKTEKWGKLFDKIVKKDGALDTWNRYCDFAQSKSSNQQIFSTIITPESILNYSFSGLTAPDSIITNSDLTPIYKLFSSQASQDLLPEALEVARLDYTPKLKRIQLLLSILDNSSFFTNSDKEYLRKVYDEQNKLYSYLINSAESILNSVTPCMFSLLKNEKNRQMNLLFMENYYQEIVFYALDALHVFNAPNETANKLKSQFPHHPIWQHSAFAGLNMSIPFLDSVNQLLVSLSHMREAFTFIEGYENDYNQNGGIKKSDVGKYIYYYRKTDLAVRLALFLKHGLMNKFPTSTNDNIQINYPKNFSHLALSIYGYTNREEPTLNIVGESNDHNISFEDRLQDFQKSTLNKFQEYTRYFFSIHANIPVLQRLLASHITLSKAKLELPTLVNESPTCVKSCENESKLLYKKYLENILRVNNEVLKALNLNSFDDDKSILNLFQSPSYYSYYITGPDFLFVSNNNADYRITGFSNTIFYYSIAYHLGNFAKLRGYDPLLDQIFSSTGFLNDAHIIPEWAAEELENSAFRESIFKGAENIATSIHKRNERLFFSIPSSTLTRIDLYFSHLFATEMRFAYMLEEQSKRYVKNNSVPSMQFDLRMKPFEHDYVISPSLLNNFYEDMRDFNSKTFNTFLPEELKENPNYTKTR